MARIRLLQRLVLAFLLLVVGGITALYFLGRAARVAPADRDVAAPLERGTDAQVGEGFDHTVSQEGRPLFRIRGLRDRRDREGNLHVEEVLVTVFRADGSRFEMAAERGTYSLELRQARLEGAVRLEGGDGFVLEGDALELLENGTRIESEGPVRFRSRGTSPFSGEAGGFSATPEDGLYLFRDGVTAASTGEVASPFDLEAERLVLQYEDRLVRADGEVRLRWGDSVISARRIAAHLDPQEDVVHFVRARWEVRGDFSTPATERSAARRLTANGHTLSLELEPESRQPRKMELQGQGEDQAELRVMEEGRRLELAADLVEADFAAGVLTRAIAGGGVLLSESGGPEHALVRRAGGRQVRAWLGPEGQVERLEITGEAELHEGGDRVFADRLIRSAGQVEAIGSPATLIGDRGELKAPRITFAEETRLTHATGGVEAVLEQQAGNPLEGTPLAEGGEDGEPVRVVAQEAFWREEPRSFLFRGSVRAWSGERLVLADELRGELDDERLSAAGSVQTVFFTPATEERASRQVRVSAGRLSYSAAERLLVYQEEVVAVEGGRTLSCSEMEVALAEDGEAESLLCSGVVRLEAPEHGRSVRADRAEYNLPDEQVVFFGRPVILLDRQGGEVTGRRVTYSTVTGKVTVAGEEAIRDQAGGLAVGRGTAQGGVTGEGIR